MMDFRVDHIDESALGGAGLRQFLDAAGIGFWELDVGTGVMRRSACHDTLFGCENAGAEWTLGDTIAGFVPEDRATVADAFAEARITGTLTLEKRIQPRNGGPVRWVHFQGRTQYQDGKPLRMTGTVHDVSDARHIARHSGHTHKMEGLERFAGKIAHDLNNLLMIIGASVEMLGERITADERSTRLVRTAMDGVSRAANLNAALLAFGRPAASRPGSIPVDSFLASMTDELRRLVGDGIQVAVMPGTPAMACIADRFQLRNAILNLAANARDAMPDGGELRLSTALEHVQEATAAAFGTRAGDYITIDVADTGCGISDAHLPKVFEPYFTTKEPHKEKGLGLSYVHTTARQAGGFATVESKLGSGTVVRICLPRSQEST